MRGWFFLFLPTKKYLAPKGSWEEKMTHSIMDFEKNRKDLLKCISCKSVFSLIYISFKNWRWINIEEYDREIKELEKRLELYNEVTQMYRTFDEEFVLVCNEQSKALEIVQELRNLKNLSIHQLFVNERKLNAVDYVKQIYIKSLNNKELIEYTLNKEFLIDEFKTVFQPILHRTNKYSLEALSRWNSKKLGSVPPNDFIPILDRNGKLADLTKKIINESVELLKCFEELVYITINLPASLVKDITWLTEHLDSIGFQDNERLAFELTEESSIGPEMRENLKSIRSRGHLLFIDDFGSGYANFQYLASFQFDGVKLDRLFVADPINKDVVILISKLVKSLDLKLIIEGVEKIEQINGLLDTKYDAIQGYYISYPLNKKDLTAFLLTS